MKYIAILAVACLIIIICTNFDETKAQLTQVGRVLTRRLGPSGKPMRHFKLFSDRKSALNAAQNAGKSNKPVEHKAHKPGQKPHFHPADKNGNIIKDGSHYQFPNKFG